MWEIASQNSPKAESIETENISTKGNHAWISGILRERSVTLKVLEPIKFWWYLVFASLVHTTTR